MDETPSLQDELLMIAQDGSVGDMAKFLHQHGEEVIVTEYIVQMAATSFQAEEMTSFLIRHRGADFKITEGIVSAVIKQSIQGPRKERPYSEEDDSIYAGEVLSLLLWERPDEVHFTESMLQDIPLSRNGCDIMYVILKMRPTILPTMDDDALDFFAPAIDGETMGLLLDLRGDEIVITENVLLSLMASCTDTRNVLKVLLDRRYNEVVITNETLEKLRLYRKHQGGPSKMSATMTMLLRQYEDKVTITDTLVLQVARYCRTGVMDILLTKWPDKVVITEELLAEAAANDCPNGHMVLQLLLRKGQGDKTITEKIFLQAGYKLIPFLLRQSAPDFRFTEEGIVSLVRTFSPYRNPYRVQVSTLLDPIFERYEGRITERIVEAAAQGLWASHVVSWMLDRTDRDFRLTPRALELAAQSFSSSHELLQIFQKKQARDFHLTEGLLIATVGNHLYRTTTLKMLLQDALEDEKRCITENVLLEASRSQYYSFDRGYMDLLLRHRPRDVSITTHMLELAARVEVWPYPGAFFHLLNHCDKELVTQSVLLAAAENNIDPSRHVFFHILNNYDVEVTQEIVAAAAANNGKGLLVGEIHHMVPERLSEKVMVAGMKNKAQANILLGLRADRITITDKVIEAAVRGNSPKTAMEYLIRRHGDQFEVTETVTRLAAEHPSQGPATMALLLKERGSEVIITEGILKGVVEKPDDAIKILELLLRERRIEVENSLSEAVLVAAASCGQLHVLRILSKIKSEIKLDPLLYEKCKFQHAARQGNVDIVQTMLKDGFDPDVRSTSGFTPLWLAAYKGRHRMVDVLLRTGQVDVNVQDKLGRTPLMVPISSKQTLVVRRLVQAGADYDIKDNEGHNAYWWSLEHSSKGLYPLPVKEMWRDP